MFVGLVDRERGEYSNPFDDSTNWTISIGESLEFFCEDLSCTLVYSAFEDLSCSVRKEVLQSKLNVIRLKIPRASHQI